MNIIDNKNFTTVKTRIIAIVITALCCVISVVNICKVSAISNQGFVNESEITPPNQVLFKEHNTGIIENPDSLKIYACCCKLTNNSKTYTGTIFATTSSNYNNVILQNVYQAYSHMYYVGLTAINYKGITIYLNTNHMLENILSDNNYTYAEFDEKCTPLNSEAISFCEYVISDGQNTGGGSTAHTLQYSLPPGNIAIIETDSSYSYVNLTTTMPLQSTSFASNPWPNTTQRIGYYGNLPQTLNPTSMGNVIEWERNGNTTLFNVTTSAKYNPSVVSTFKYVVIANPYYYPANDMEDRQFTNGAINISMDGVVNITVKSLTATVNPQTGEVENNYNGEEWTGEVDDNTNDIIWTDGNGDNNAPTSGGNLSDSTITGFQSWLKGILNNIVNIFEPAHDAITTLSSAVRNFASWMYALYVWLPSPILSLLTSAISLAIVIGIIKVFI